MAHKFPKHRLITDTPVAISEINHNVREYRNELGRLNEHNIKEHAFSDRTHAEPDFAIHVNNEFVSFNPYMNFGDGTGDGDAPAETATPPTPYADDRVSVDGSTEWQTVVTYTKFTGNSLLWVLASFQQQTYGPSSLARQGYPGGIYALRIDGTVIDETRTGGVDRANDPAGESIACQAYPYVLDMVVPMSPGSHTIELVSRAPHITSAPLSTWIQSDSDYLTMVFNRELIIVTLDPETEAVDGTTTSFTPLEEGDAINATTIRGPFDSVKNAYNSLEYPDIQPESLHASHCPSTVIESDQATVGTLVTHSYTNVYPGFEVDTMGDPGWEVIDDGTDRLEIFFASVIDMTDTTIAGVLIGCDLNVINLEPDSGVTTESDLTYVIIALQFKDDAGVWKTVGRTERYTNSVYDEDLVVQLALRKNIGFRTFLTVDDLFGSASIEGVRAVVSVFDRSNSASATVELQQGSLWYAVLQGGS